MKINKFKLPFFALLFFVISCAKESVDENFVDTKQNVSINFMVDEIESPIELNASIVNDKQQGFVFKDKELGQGLYSSISTAKKSNVSKNFSSVNKFAAIGKMEKGVKYLTLVYKYKFNRTTNVEGEKILLGAEIGESGTRTTIRIPKPESSIGINEPYMYRVISFTYNEKNTNGYPDITTVNSYIGHEYDYELNIPTDRAFYLYVGNYDLGLLFNSRDTQGNPIDQREANFTFTFKPITSKFTLTFDAQATYNVFKEIGGIITSKGNYNNAKFSFKTLTYSLTPVAYSATDKLLHRFMFNTTFNGTSYVVNTASVPKNKIEYSTYLHVNDIKSFTDLGLKVAVQHLKIVDGQNVTKLNKTYSQQADSDLEYNFTSLTFQNKYQSFGNIYIYEGFKSGNTLWSLANLYYDENAEITHKFRPSANAGRGIGYINTDYWRPNYMYPTSQLEVYQGDPCSKAYPSGWRLPTTAEIDAMINNGLPADISREYVHVKSLSSDVRTHYLEFTNTATNQKLQFYGAGYVVGNSIINFGPGGEDTEGSSASNSAIFLGGNSVGFFDRDYETLAFTFWRTLLSSSTAGWSDAKTNYTYINTRFNARCVRTIE